MGTVILDGHAIAKKAIPGSTIDIATELSGVVSFFRCEARLNPTAPSAALLVVVRGDIVYEPLASTMASGGHAIGVLGYILNKNTSVSIPLLVATEGQVINDPGATIALATGLVSNLENNGSITTWHGVYSILAKNTGTITGPARFFSCSAEGVQSGTIASLYGFYFPTLTTPPTVSGDTVGFYFGNNPVITTNKYCFRSDDAGALLYSAGDVLVAKKTSTETFVLASGTKTATSTGTDSASTATLNKASGKITTNSIATAFGASHTLTLTNSQIAAADTVYASIDNGTNTAGRPLIGRITPAAGSVVIVVENTHAAAALNGTLVISFASMKVS